MEDTVSLGPPVYNTDDDELWRCYNTNSKLCSFSYHLSLLGACFVQDTVLGAKVTKQWIGTNSEPSQCLRFQ